MKSFSKSSRIFAAAICFVSLTALQVHGFVFLVTLDENGNGTASNQPLPYAIGIDGCPGGLTNVLAYDLPFPGTAGDVVLTETGGTTTNHSDMIRFFGNNVVGFYSDVSANDPADSLADVGVPQWGTCSTNVVFLQEIGTEASNGCVYAPAPGQPGYDAAYQPTYNFISDAPPPVTVNISLDENGNGFTNGLRVTGVLTNDPGPGGQAHALTYPLPFPGVVGDVLIMESPTGGQHSDMLRFNGTGTAVFYSDTNVNDIADSLADTGMPGDFYTFNFTNVLEVGTEGSNGCVYVPSPGQPGYDPSNPIYNIISDVPVQTNTVTIDENGNGTVNGQPITAVLTNDPGPCGVGTLNVLTYRLPTPYVGTTGDVLLLEPQTGLPSDLLRFNGNGTVIFYSDIESGDIPDLADVGLPCSNYPNLYTSYETYSEGSNGFAYTTFPGSPGWDPNYPVVFNFISDVPPSITIDEDGKGSLNGVPITGVVTNDTGPGGQARALTYSLPFAGAPGDVLLFDGDISTNVQDIIRFNGNGTVVFYSDPFLLSPNAADPCDNLADGLGPTNLYPNQVSLPELGTDGTTNYATYTPGPGAPGYDPSGPTYTFISDYPPLASDPFTAWQQKYFGCTNLAICPQAAGNADPDGDGMSNTNEFLAGTVPTSSLSSLRITSITRLNINDIKIVWTSVGCKGYIVQVFPGNAPDGSYSNNFTDIASSLIIDTGKGEGTLSYLDVGGATNKPSRYYRVKLLP